jgi:hypothetical protein
MNLVNKELTDMIAAFKEDRSWAPYVLPKLSDNALCSDNHIWSIYCMSVNLVKMWDELLPLTKNKKITIEDCKAVDLGDTTGTTDKKEKPKSDKVKLDTTIYKIDPVPVSCQVGGFSYDATLKERQSAHNIQKIRAVSGFPVPQFSWVKEVEILKMKVVKTEKIKVSEEYRGKMSRFFNNPIKKDHKVTVIMSYCKGYYFNITPVYTTSNLYRTSEWSDKKVEFHDFFARSLILKHMGMTSEDGGREAIVRAIESSANVYLNSSSPIDFLAAKRVAQNVLIATTNLAVPSIRLFQQAPNHC